MTVPNVLLSAFSTSRLSRRMNTAKRMAALLVLALSACTIQAQAQTADRIPKAFDATPAVVLAEHHPLWASPANDLGALDANQNVDNLTMVLARSPEQQKAFEQFLSDQQTPGSPNYHHWLTPVEIGQQYGLTDHDVASIGTWLKGQGLHVNWVAPSKMFLSFGGPAANVGKAFGTEMHTYTVHGEKRISVSSDAKIPTALAPTIQAVRGLFTIEERPQHRVRVVVSDKPDLTVTTGSGTEHFIAPGDFYWIYDSLSDASSLSSGETIGIVAESRTDMSDFSNFMWLMGVTFNEPTEVVPTAFGGVDPGAAFTAPPSCATANPPTCSNAINAQIDAQSEATLDVQRAGSTAWGANLLLVANSGADGIATDAQYLTETTPIPAQVMSISFGGCESEGGQSDVNFWDNIYQTGAAEGISTFVASGDAGAAGCDTYFKTPPVNPAAVSPNALCSSSYATCVGGTEFNDTANPTEYWGTSNGEGGLGNFSAFNYIPEGAWNEPTNSAGGSAVAATGGGVSQYIATPSWQTGTGVPTARTGRYTPDVSFSASGHDAYFGCLAVAGGSCVSTSQGTPFVAFEGTSAAAPAMAGVAALLDKWYSGPQGNINPQIYSLAANAPSVFHDVTVASSGVTSCSVNTPSMCNNSIPGPTSLTTGAEAGYLVQTGYDEATGWGSLDVDAFIDSYGTEAGKMKPTVQVTPSPTSVTTAQSLNVNVTVSGGSGNPTATGTVTLTGGGYTSSAVTLTSGAATIPIAAGALAAGSDTLTVSYTPDSNSIETYFTATGTVSIAVSLTNKVTPTLTLSTTTPITIQEPDRLSLSFSNTGSYPFPSGTVVLTSGSNLLFTAPTDFDWSYLSLPAGTFPLGPNTMTATYTPDTNGALIYGSATGTATVVVDPMQTPTITVSPASTSVNAAQSFQVTVTLGPATGFPAPGGFVELTSGNYFSQSLNLTGGVAVFIIPAGTFQVGTYTLSASYASYDNIYNNASATTTAVISAAPDFSLSAAPSSISFAQGSTATTTVTITPLNGFTDSVSSGTAGLPNGVTVSNAPGTAPNTYVATFTATTSAQLGTTNVTISGNDGALSHSTTVALEITPEPSFGPPSGDGIANLTLTPGATTGNTTVVNVLATNGFSGTVALTCTVIKSQGTTSDMPTCGLSPTSLAISGTATQTSTLTVNTTAATSAANRMPRLLWPATGGTALALMLFFLAPRQRRGWLAILALVAIVAGVSACGGGGSGSGGGGGGGGGGNSGTSTGTYTITVTGTSGTEIVTLDTVTLTVQ